MHARIQLVCFNVFFYLYKNLLLLYNKANLIEILFVLNLRAAKLKFSRVENGKMRENID